MIKINEPRLILIHGKGKTDGAGKQKGWLQLSLLDDKWPCVVLARGSFFFFSACIKRLWGYHSSHHCHHHYQHFHLFLSCPALINMEPLMQPDSTDNVCEAKSTLNWITLTDFIFSRRTFTQLLWNTNGHRVVKIVYTADH